MHVLQVLPFAERCGLRDYIPGWDRLSSYFARPEKKKEVLHSLALALTLTLPLTLFLTLTFNHLANEHHAVSI